MYKKIISSTLMSYHDKMRQNGEMNAQ